jgi:hypothetical protein
MGEQSEVSNSGQSLLDWTVQIMRQPEAPETDPT